jgi:hypothetical protein
MPKYKVYVERSAVEMATLIIEAESQEDAEWQANEMVNDTFEPDTTDFSSDEESVWEVVDAVEEP